MTTTRFHVLFALACTLFLSAALSAQQAPAPLVAANPAPHEAPTQPLPFSHRTHLAVGQRCQTCHTAPGDGRQMTFPATATCMTCHRTIASGRPAVRKLAEFAASGQAVPWVRVYQVLPGVTWSHRPHVAAGVECETCHGAVRDMAVMSKTTAVTGMASCVSCHQARQAATACATCHPWPATPPPPA